MMAPFLDDGPKLWGRSGRVAVRVMLLGVVMAGLAGCQTDGDEVKLSDSMRATSETVRGAGLMDVRNAVVDVMADDGFRLVSPFGNVMTFEKEGSRHDEIKYGSYGSEPLRQRVTISIELGDEADTLRLRAEGKLVRSYAHLTGEESDFLFSGGGRRYAKYLKTIKHHVESGPGGGAAAPALVE